MGEKNVSLIWDWNITIKQTGLFITFEGIDGSGKSLQSAGLKAFLEKLGKQVILTRDPGGTVISENIRQVLLDREHTRMHPVTELLLYESARAQLVEEIIRPQIQKGGIVICDRFTDSTFAYQGCGRSLDADMIKTGNQLASGGLEPHITFWLDIDWETSINRRIRSGKIPDRMENQKRTFFENVRKGYQALADDNPDRIVKLDGSRSVEDLEQIIQDTVLQLMDK